MADKNARGRPKSVARWLGWESKFDRLSNKTIKQQEIQILEICIERL
jgi:hypothetical protein